MSICCRNRNMYPFLLLERWKRKHISVSICLWSIVQKMIPPKWGGQNCPEWADLPAGKKKDFYETSLFLPWGRSAFITSYYYSLMPVLAAYQNFFLSFFIVCRFCTSKQSFGYFCLWWAMLVFVDALVCDWEKKSFGWRVLVSPGSTKTFHVLVLQKVEYQNFIQLPFSAMPLGLSILQSCITI